MSITTQVTIEAIIKANGKPGIRVRSPYHPDFPEAARNLGGTWDGAVWRFDGRDEASVRALCLRIYGTCGEEDTVDLCTIRLALVHSDGSRPFGSRTVWACGRMVADRIDRDSKVRLGTAVVVVSGGFPGRGGSRAHPELNPDADTVLEVRDVPRMLAERLVATYPELATILPDSAGPAAATHDTAQPAMPVMTPTVAVAPQ